ncbi:diaminopimelate dehydrogenase [Glutamicibacter arilaitensis]|jgi:diaminopimelate dehydrogenase|uniref:Meso-diaminopimelate D-dehydrogenase n=2 Tax=Glutamicibacter arilaitensis TaxID=256701 RepID=A0A2N7S0K1_9MICC|nr:MULTISPECIES: diaminopimelate dehydrogenase [Glutamicibacter]PMQ19661.1 diaminopimelate dehydrogenase [Glutamicibacter arilaitensis]CBT74380.1 diaminopimelate dehydrogenase [Glutamicibacter arilaitensis Re117]HCH48582.1 diaminopimelate dehydrogenase [Glutamicibacter sp.]HCJ53328.1 diaminopimelate dehydrogenase [Glutamicibacter sp.]
MTSKIRIGIAGYGNLGRGVQSAIAKNPDMELVGVYTRRDPGTLDLAQPAPRFAMDELEQHAGGIDVLILCGGSRSDLPEQGPKFAALFNTVDSFDTHARIPEYFQSVDAPAKAAGKTALISVGWDPGMFSINRVFGEALLPDGQTYTFWGRGLSQGHSDAIRRVPGVAAGVQYTIPSQEAIDRVRAGQRPSLSTREKHQRECFVVLEDGADAQAVREAIVGMEHYFDQYDTTVEFIDEQTLAAEHSNMPHGGFVIRSGNTSDEQKQVIEYSLALGSNPEFTSSVLVAYARAAYRMNQSGITGAQTVYDVAPGLLSPKSPAQLRAELL